jgi:muconolactone D-isomerase
MLFFFKLSFDHKGMSEEELWDLWEKETEAALVAKAAGKVLAIYKVVGQRRVVGIADIESHDELDRIVMAGLPMKLIIECEELLPVRPYEDFAEDVKRRWQS